MFSRPSCWLSVMRNFSKFGKNVFVLGQRLIARRTSGSTSGLRKNNLV
jgi:hypothetical protein